MTDTRSIIKMPTHKCSKCGAFWRFCRKEDTGFYMDTWHLVSRSAKECCDNVSMGSHIKPLSLEDVHEFLELNEDSYE